MLTRREFSKKMGVGSAGVFTLGLNACTTQNNKKNKPVEKILNPSEKLNLAFVGITGRGLKNIRELTDHNIVALCDVDWNLASKTFNTYPKATRYKDFRQMLEKEKSIDAVVISTPDHNHGVIAAAAIKMGKHVYCEKPLAHSIYETREVTRLAKEYGVQSQMGNQGHSTDTIREFYEHINGGTIGKVTEVHAWCDRPAGGNKVSFPHGISRPTGDYSIPDTLDWDLWLGPAQDRPYNPAYLPKKWRGFLDFGCGALGDFGCHTLDPAFWALDLGSPESVIASTSNLIPNMKYDTFPTSEVVTYKFPRRGEKPPVKMVWYDGGIVPLHDDRFRKIVFPSCGGLVVGENGMIIHGSHGASNYVIVRDNKKVEVAKPAELMERSKGHHQDWIDAIKTGIQASASFDYGGPLTETVLLGVAASRFRNKELFWDNEKMKVTNFGEANSIIRPEFRKGWEV